MAAPPLRIPVALDLEQLKQQTQKASAHVGDAVKAMGQAFTKLNGQVVGAAGASQLAWSQSLTKTALGFAGLATAAIVAFKLIAGAIDITREKLAEMVAIADKSRDTGVGAEFFQKFIAGAKNLKISAEDLESALTHAFQATKEKSPVDLAKWEVGEEIITDVEKALRVYNETLVKTTGGRLEGLVLFRDADTQEKKIIAILEAMKQLNEIGQKTAALELGEKMFGAQTADRIRQGRTSAEEMLTTMKAAADASNTLFPNELVQRAKQVDDELKIAEDRLSRAMKPTMEGLANDMLKFKSLWAGTVELIAKAVELLNNLDTDLVGRLVTQMLRMVGVEPLAALPKGQLGADAGLGAIGPRLGADSRGTGAAPTLKTTATAAGGRDRFESTADAIEKRTKALSAENDAINLGTEARERAKISAELETVAKQLNGTVSAEQKKRIDELADAYGKMAAKIEQSRAPLETFARESANLGKQLNEFAATSLNGVTNELANIVTGTKTASEAFSAMAKAIINDLAKIAIRQAITGPIAKALGGVFAVGGGGGAGLFAAADGGTFDAGRWGVVGERGPELIQTHHGGGVSVYPNIPGFANGGFLPAPKGGGGSTVQGAVITINAPGADKAGLARVEAAVIRLNSSLETRAVRAVADASSRGHNVIRR